MLYQPGACTCLLRNDAACSWVLQGLRGSIPPNFPYFHVEINLTRGFVHVIDDETQFDANFGRSILIGLLGLPQESMHR